MVFVFSFVSLGIFVARGVQAQDNPAQTTAEVVVKGSRAVCLKTAAVPSTCPPDAIGEVLDTIGKKIASPAFRVALVQSLMNLSRFVLDRLAYEAAVAVASGGPGEGSLFYNKTPAEAFGQLGLEAAGEAVATMSDLTGDLGYKFNLCSPDGILQLALAIGIKQKYQPSAPRCDILEVGKAWGSFFTNIYQTVTDPEAIQEAVLSKFAESLKPGQNEISAALRTNIAIDGKVREAKLLELMGITKDEYKPVTDFITGDVKTPSATVTEDFHKKLSASDQEKVKVGDLVGAGDLIGGLALTTASTFTNTLLSTLFSRIYTGLFDVSLDIDPFDVEATAEGSKETAQARFASIFSSSPIATTQYNALGEFVVCVSGNVSNRGLNNCVMDTNFMAAVSRGSSGAVAALTVQEAIDEGLLNGDWPLISPEDTSANQDPYCYTYGYCYGNLVKLRKARVIPVGWELAALRNDSGSPATLQDIVDGFDDCTEDGTIGPANSSSGADEWCHLIDPNWVLKYPETQCRAIANGEIRIGAQTPGRASSCVDAPSCIGEDNDGNCSDGYGYCVREKNTWRFRGDECPEEYSTCLSFENTFTGDKAAYRVSSVDYSVCDSNNAGCRWYATQKHYEDAGTADDDSDDTYEFLPDGETYTTATHDSAWKYQLSTGDSEEPVSYSYTSDSGEIYSNTSYAYNDRIYFTNEAEECSEDDIGCTRLNEFNDDLVFNQIQNPSFESDEDEDDVPDNWTNGSAATSAQTMQEDDGPVSGSFSFSTDASILEQYVSLSPNNFYTLSFSARADNTAAAETYAYLYLYDEFGEAVSVAGTSYGGDCVQGTSSYVITADPTDSSQFTSGEWTQFDCTFTTPEDVAQGLLKFDSDEILLDAVQLELGEDVSNFTEDYNTSATEVYYQVAPDYLGCTGDADTDPSECDDYAQVCSAQEVGCNLYTPEDGDPDVPAIISELDECPEECVGYTTYKQEATDYDSEEFPLYFIADRATSCSSQYIGCDSYTNLDAVDAGGEGTENYSSLRFCLSEDIADSSDKFTTPATFFTWEGSDNEGYQLQTWYLLESNVVTSSGTFSGSGYVEDSPDLAPCTHVTMTSENDVSCNDSFAGNMSADVWDNADCDEHDDIFDNPDCREFFDTEGNIHYREYPDTISISNDCAPYRKDESTETDCEDSGGYWTDQGFCRYYVLADESTECPAEQSGCREYTGGTGRNATTILDETFEDGTYDDFVISETSSSTSSLSVSNESIATDGHSLYVSATGGLAGFETIQIYLDSATTTETYDEAGDAAGTSTTCTGNGGTIGDSGCDVENDVDADGSADEDCTIEDSEESCGALTSDLVGGKTFVVDFWAKGSGNMYVTFEEEGGSGDTHDLSNPSATISSASDLTPVELTGSWQLFSLGPLDTSDYADFDENAVLRFRVASAAEAYVDNISLKQVEEDITLIKDSWVVPSTCDATADGVESDQYYLGCEAYTDQNGVDADLYQFSDLCSEDVVGCEGFFDTGNSDSSYQQVYNARCMYSSDTDFSDEPETVGANTTCEIDGVEYCTITSGSSYCTFDADTVLEEPLPSEAVSSTVHYAVVFGPETVIVPTDAPVYLVADDTYECDEEAMGCEELGLPTFNQDQSEVDSFESVYYLNLPEDYDTLLCSDEELFCEEWDSTQDGNFYFKDPLDKTCEYQDSVTIGNQEYSGWFRSGTTEPCDWTDSDASGDFDPDEDDSYLINGNEFGVWANGDDDYDGWVAACEDAYDLCTEFVDVVDTAGGGGEDGESYYFTNDDLLSEDTLTDTQRCDGQVSQKFGCAVFNNTTDSELSYNAGASYVVSMHADVFFGEEQNSLQDPIDCELDEGGEFTVSSSDADALGLTSETVDLCARRCSYEVEDGDSIDTPSATEVSSTQVYERSCLVDDDCPVLTTNLGEDVTATCEDVSATYALDDDANEVIKVNRDRSCSAWLACESSKTSWNTTSSTYDTICDSINLCVEGTNQGDTSTCTQWDSSDPEILGAYQYSARDVNWFGEEWSGGTIPNQLPTDLYTQFNLEPTTVCMETTSTELTNDAGLPTYCNTYEDCGVSTTACTTNADCASYSGICSDSGYCYYSCANNSDTDYRLVYNAGPCDATESGDGNGGSCSIGMCEDSGSACASDDDCSGSEACVVGYCQASGTTNCVNSDCSCNPDNDNSSDGTNSDCTTNTTDIGLHTYFCDPVQFVCVDKFTSENDFVATEACDADTSCSAYAYGATCVPASTSTTGECFNNRCLSDIKDDNGDGYADTLAISGGEVTSGREMGCRGYPEIDSPYPTSVVDDWKTFRYSTADGTSPTDATFSASGSGGLPASWYSLPYAYVGGFQDSAVCGLDLYGEPVDCDCSYDKVEYGEGSGYRYYEAGTGADTFSQSGEVPDGICTGGPVPGLPCLDDDDCSIGTTQVGTCSALSGVSTMYGWEGYCIEKDTSIQTLGSSDTEDQACLSWLPVDQLAGSTDLYGKYTSAGYTPQETYYCADIEAAYSVWTSNILCAEEVDDYCDGGLYYDHEGTEAEQDDAETTWDVWLATANDPSSNSTNDDCISSVFCPEGYFAVMTGCGGQDNSTYHDLNGGASGQYCGASITTDDCPYFCVPKFSYKTATDAEGDDGDRCLSPGNYYTVDYSVNTSDVGDHWYPGLNVEVYVLAPWRFDNAFELYDDCAARGVLGDSLDEFTSPYDLLEDGIPTTEDPTTCYGNNLVSCGYYYSYADGITGVDSLAAWVFTRYPACSTLVQVSATEPNEDDYPFDSYNAAWTDRLWESSSAAFSIADPGGDDAHFGYTYDTLLSPYGVATDPEELAVEFTTDDNPDPWAHTPVMCSEGNDDYQIPPVETTTACDASASSFTSTAGEDARSFRDFSMTFDSVVPTSGYTTFTENDTIDDAISRLSQLFGRIYGMIQFEDGYEGVAAQEVPDGALTTGFNTGEQFGSWTPVAYEDLAADEPWLWDTRSVGDDDNEPEPPTVVSVGDCVGTECIEDTEGKFNIGEVDGGDLEGEGTYHANVSFFTYANSNQMPIRRIVIDWGDDFGGVQPTGLGAHWPTGSQSGSTAEDNFYQNHRGLNATSEQEICGSDPVEFGTSSTACSTSYINFAHDYICTDGDTALLTSRTCEYDDTDTTRLLNSPCLDSSGACVFQPRVSVTDNWGWCTGFCDAGADGTDNCFSGETEDGTSVRECNIESCPSEGDSSSCVDYGGAGTANPWINFDGTIAVTPD